MTRFEPVNLTYKSIIYFLYQAKFHQVLTFPSLRSDSQMQLKLYKQSLTGKQTPANIPQPLVLTVTALWRIWNDFRAGPPYPSSLLLVTLIGISSPSPRKRFFPALLLKILSHRSTKDWTVNLLQTKRWSMALPSKVVVNSTELCTDCKVCPSFGDPKS